MGVDYGWEKFFSAFHYAVASTTPLQERLAGVMMGVSHLQRHDFHDDETWKRFEKLMKGTTHRLPRGKEGTIQATTSQMTDDEASKWLQEAFGIFCELAEAYGKEQTP